MQLITGSKGQLGKELLKLYPDAIAVDRDELDISDEKAVREFNWDNIDVIFNAAAFTAVDAAETSEGKLAAQAVNVNAVKHLANIARERDILLAHISSDYVFDGRSSKPYSENDEPNPLSVYGKTKVDGDKAAATVPKYYIVRTSWLIGDGNNFVRTMLKLGSEKDRLAIVSDQIGRPTFAEDLAAAIKHLCDVMAPFGTYNFTNNGDPVSWAEFARTIFKMAEIDCDVADTTTADYSEGKSPWATRPYNSVLDLKKISETGLQISNWKSALATYLNRELKK